MTNIMVVQRRVGRRIVGSTDPPALPRFCSVCGAPVILVCQGCRAPIPDETVSGPFPPDPFCTECGQPFPWATRQDRLGQLVLYLEAEGVDSATQLAAREAIEELASAVADDPTSTSDKEIVAAGRLRQLMPKLWDNAKPVLQSVLSEAAKKALGL